MLTRFAQATARDAVGLRQDTQPLQGQSGPPYIENIADFSLQDSRAASQPYSQAVKLRIEHAQRLRADMHPGEANSYPNATLVGLNISCECECPVRAPDSYNEMMVSLSTCFW